MKRLSILALLICLICLAKAQDTCVVALRIDDKTTPFEVKPDKDGRLSGFFTKGLNGDIYLYTNRPFIKVVNESSKEMRNKLTDEYRVIIFDKGSATTFDYTNKTEDRKWAFIQKNVNNFQNMIYFGGDIQANTFWFQLENNTNYRRTFKTRSSSEEFDGLKGIDITVTSPEGVDSVYTFKDSEHVDTLNIYTGYTIKKIAATRGRNGILSALVANGDTLKANYSYRNKEGVFEEDNFSVRNATLTTADSTLNIAYPCELAVVYTYLEGDNNVQVDNRKIHIEMISPEEEGSSAWIWILLVLLVAGGIGGYFYRRYQLKKAGIIPETDAEKVVRLQKEVATHTATINGLEQTKSSLLTDKSNLQNEVAKLNQDLVVSRQETKDKAEESDGYRDALANLQRHTDDIQGQLDNANDRIKVFESNHEHIENLALHQQLEELHLEMDNQKRADAERLRNTIAKKDEERAKAVAEKQQEMLAAQQKNESELKSALAMREDELNASLIKKQQELNEALAKKQQELEDTKLSLAREKNDALAKLEGETTSAYDQMKRDLAGKIALLTQARQSDAEKHQEALNDLQIKTDQMIAQIQTNAAAEIDDIKTSAAKEIAETKALAEKTVAETKSAAESAIAETKSWAENTVATAKANAEKLVADTKSAADKLVADTKNAATTEITQIRTDKATALQQAAALLASTKADLEKRLADTEALASKTVNDTKSWAEKSVAEIRSNASTVVEETRAKAAKEIAEAKNYAETTVAQTKATAKAELDHTKATAEAEIASTKAKAEAEIAETKAAAKAAVDEANETAEKNVAEANEKAAAAIAQAKEECEKRVAEEEEKTRKANAVIAAAGQEYVAFINNSIEKVFEQISLLQSESAVSPLDNNHKNVISHLSLKFTSFRQWFHKTIVQGQSTNGWSVKEIEQIIQKELTPILTNNYSWLSELVRFYSYTSINRRFTDEFRKSFVPVDYVKSSYAETVTLFGKLGITLYVPHLFVDVYDKELHKLNNTPLINSYYPQGFIEFRTENKGLIYDLLRPGFAINGELQQLPDVCVF